MLLNPSHKVTFSGLPPDILDAYVRYKKGTRALVAWFVSYSNAPNRKVKSLPIKELASLAQVIASSLKQLPDVIHFHFRETIAARNRLSKHFRGTIDASDDEVDTVNHEHFTSSLSRIYADLCVSCGKPEHQPRDLRRTRKSSLISEGGLINHYEALTVQDVEDVADDSSETSNTSASASTSPSECSECIAVAPPHCDGSGLDVFLADDDLGRAMEVTATIQRAQDIVNSVERCWESAGQGEISFVTAAFMTNVGFASLRRLGLELLEQDIKLDISDLHQICCSIGGKDGPESSHRLLDTLQEVERSLGHYRDGHQLTPISSCASCVQKPADYIQSPSIHNHTRPKLLDAIIDNIIHLVVTPSPPSNIVRTSTPVYADVGYFLTHRDQEPQSWSAIMGLHLLNQGYKTYLSSTPTPNLISKHRITALQLAQQALSHVTSIVNDKTCFPCRCTQTLGYHLQTLEHDLLDFSRHKCWDLYFQSPWVAGTHVLEILDLCHYYGMRLINYRHYVGAVLHSYNVLQKLGGLEQIPVLEDLCELFHDVLFPGGVRPSYSYRSCWGRYVGARLKFKKGHKNRNSRDSWCMAIPAHAARRAAGLGSTRESGPQQGLTMDCLIFRLIKQGYHVGDEDWGLQEGEMNDAAHDLTTVARNMQILSSRVEESITWSSSSGGEGGGGSRLPMSRLNLLAVFQKCVDVVKRLSDETHTGKDEQGINCICFASAILTGADRISEARRLGRMEAWTKNERACITQAKAVISDVFAGLSPDHLLWKI
ncbi:hypothetical protein PV10_08622 [Exophiala mesophila]|uniref:DUF6604 domain-containing protein n=1 Tax=Exophiala mesophila TaxID=212818 RepID=A0A0D1Z2P5_EXOME|nr:uncharacterized protein PV10_08622 [Exophiala mesophila]KIV89002.1 hypothetical protein PV10_08622 [Exophiala mesophila]